MFGSKIKSGNNRDLNKNYSAIVKKSEYALIKKHGEL